MEPHRVTVLLLDQVLPLDFAIPMHMLAREAAEFYRVVTASPDGGPVAPAGGGLRLMPDGGLRLLLDAQTVIVPGYGGASTTKLAKETVASLRSCHDRGARMVSICSGAFALAQAGVLEGLRVTTHWSLCRELSLQYRSLTVDDSALFVDDCSSVLTSGGVTAGVDLLLSMLRRDLGGSVANHVARRILMPPRRDGEQTQFAETPPVRPGDDPIAKTQQWMLAALGESLTIRDMAEKAHMSSRTFHRRFSEKASMPPLEWLQRQRIGRAKELLETTDLTIEEIAPRVGLGSPANLRQHFRRATSLTPSRYRDMWKGRN